MYKIDGWCTMYETIDELLSQDIQSVSEYDDKYYFILQSNDPYHNTVWVADKNTGKVTWMSLIDYMFTNGIEDKAKPIDPATIKKAS